MGSAAVGGDAVTADARGHDTAANLSPVELDRLVDFLASKGYGTTVLDREGVDWIAQTVLDNMGSADNHARAARARLVRLRDEVRGELSDELRQAVGASLRRCGS
jgi:hypothetical protein